MPAKNPDLHGNVPESSPVALLLIDVINDMEYPGGEKLLPHALAVAPTTATFKKRCKAAGIPTIYANDNFGRWQSDFNKLVAHCCDEPVRGQPVARQLRPDDDDYFVLKPKHSGFFSTTLDVLLEYLNAKTVIIAGFTADICVLFTANDAYMRDFNINVPSDCVASLDPADNRQAIAHMKRVLKADMRPSVELDLEQLKRSASSR